MRALTSGFKTIKPVQPVVHNWRVCGAASGERLCDRGMEIKHSQHHKYISIKDILAQIKSRENSDGRVTPLVSYGTACDTGIPVSHAVSIRVEVVLARHLCTEDAVEHACPFPVGLGQRVDFSVELVVI
eukprot:COSAG01_NODE_2583_length_7421_cov_3.605163_2_plen_129_part_00